MGKLAQAFVYGAVVIALDGNFDQCLKLVRDLLQFKGFLTLEAETATRGLELAAEHLPSLILMDVQLPDMDGGAALARLRADSRTAAIPVIAVTAFAMAGDRERFLEAGFDDYVTKPIDVRSFPQLVGSFCGKGR